MASLVTDTVDDPKPGEMWTKKNPDAEDDPMTTVFIEGIEDDDVIYKSYQSYLDNDDYGASQTGIDEFLSLYSKEDELDLDDFEFLPNSYNDDDFLGIDELLDDTTEMISARDNNNNNNNKNFSDFDSGEDSSNDDDDSGGEKKKLTTIITLKKKKRPPKTVERRTTIKLKKKRPTPQKPQATEAKKPKQTTNQRKKIDQQFISMDYNTLFYPRYKGKVVPQVMTIAGEPKEIKRASAKIQTQRKTIPVYIFEIKHNNNNNIDKEIEFWSDWRRDTKAVKEWIQEINRITKIYNTNPTISNFLKALKRSFTITKVEKFRDELPYFSFKQEMAICYVHFIKDGRTNDHTWPTFQKYFKANCEVLNNLFDTLTAKKLKENLNNVKDKNNSKEVFKAHTGTTKFASDIFHKSLEVVVDKTFNFLNKEEEEQAKQDLAADYGIQMSTADAVGLSTSLLMAKLKF